MYILAQEGHTAVAEKLLSHGAQVDSRRQDGITPLIMACYKNHTSVVKLLIAKGAQVNSADNDGDTPLHCAVSANSPETVKLLLPHHPKFLCNKEGQNPLDFAKEKHHTDLVSLLEEYIKGNTIEKKQNTQSTSSAGAAGGATGDVRPKESSKLITQSQITNVARLAAEAKFKAKLMDKDWDPERELAKLGLRNDEKGNQKAIIVCVFYCY